MSFNQSRADKSEFQYRKSQGGRSINNNNSGGHQHRHFSSTGTGRGASPAPPLSSIPQPNRSFKKSTNAQGGQSRGNYGPVSVSSDSSGANSVENGGHVQSASHVIKSTLGPSGASHAPAPAAIPKPVDNITQKTNQPVPKAPSSQPSSMTSDSTLPSTPAKGDAGKGFSLQFGSISPGFMNVMQVPPRTSSAPPNLHEQKREQDQHDAARAAPAIPLPPAPKQQVPQRDVASTEPPVPQDTHADPKVKRDVHVTPTPPLMQAQKPSILPMAGMSMPMPFHQPTVPLQFGGPNPPIQSQGMPTTSLQMPMPMPLPMGNPPQVQQQVFVPGHQHHLMQTPGIVHQGQNLGFNPQLGHQLPHQLGNIGMNMSPQFNQQQAGRFGSARKTVKITHPETHEELRLDNRDGGSPVSRSHHGGPPQSQPVTYTATHPISYYPNSYAAGPSFYPPQSSLPLTSTQLTSSPQAPRFNYPVSQASAAMPFLNQPASSSFPISRGGASTLSTVEQSNLDVQNVIPSPHLTSPPVTVKASGSSGRERGIDSNVVEKVDPQKLVRPAVDSGVRRDLEAMADNSPQLKTGFENSKQSAVVPGSSVPANVEVVKKETVSKFEPIKDVEVQPEMKGHQDHGDSSKVAPLGVGDGASVSVQDSLTSANLASTGVPVVDLDIENKASEDQHAKQKDPSLQGVTRESYVAMEQGEKELGGVQSDNSLKAVDAFKKTEPVGDNKSSQKAGDLVDSQREVEFATSQPEGDKMAPQTSPSEFGSTTCDDTKIQNSITALKESISCKEDDASKSSMSDNEAAPEAKLGQDGQVTENVRPSSSSGTESSSNKSSVETGKLKNNKGKKKRKELLQKADAQGTTSDLYIAFKGPEDKKEAVLSVEDASLSKFKEVSADATPENSPRMKKDEQDKSELEDWEDAADVSVPKLESSVKAKCGGSHNDETGATGKKYSRDFLLTIAEHCTELPEGFEIPSDIADAFMRPNVNASRGDREYSSPGRIIDRPSGGPRSDRRGNGMVDADRWAKFQGHQPSGRDPGVDLAYGNSVMDLRSGANYGVLRNPRGQGTVQHAGGILSGPMHSMGFQGIQRNNSGADRWQRATNFNKGLMPSPQTPSQAMHKAENKYEIGKVTDEEQAKQRRLKAILNKLTPQNFEKLFEQVKEVNIDNAITLSGVISQIFDKALMEPTFCEMYANFCSRLASELPDLSVDNEKITFKRLLLNKCQEEFERGEREEEEANKVDGEGETKQTGEQREEKRLKARRRMLGNIRLIGELYKKRMLTERIMHECIKKLLGQYQSPEEENIEALCKLMSTIGVMIDHPKAKEHMDAYFDIMGQMSNNMNLSSRLRFMLIDTIELRGNKWRQRRKVEGPKKIEEVHRDAAQERHGQGGRSSRGPSMNFPMRRGQPLEYGPRGSMLSSPVGHMGGFRGVPNQARGYGGQDVRMDERSVFENRTLSVPLAQRSSGDEPITLGPQGGLGRGMSFRGPPSVSGGPSAETSSSYGDPRRTIGGLNGYSSASDRGAYGPREDQFARHASERFSAPSAYDQSHSQQLNPNYKNRAPENPDRSMNKSVLISPPVPLAGVHLAQNPSSEKVWPEERLRDMSIATIKEYYSAKDEKEVALCIKDMNAPSFYPTVISIWVNDAFERKDKERDMLATLLVSLAKPQEGIFSQGQLIEGFESVLTNLEDTVNDAPRAPEFLGRIFGKVILENVVPLKEVSQMIHQGGEEPGRLLEAGLAADVLGNILEMIKSEKGESGLNEIRTSSKLRVEDFRPPDPIRSKILEMFM